MVTPITSLGSLFQCLSTLSEKLYSNIQFELIPVQLKANSPYPFTWDMVKNHEQLVTSSFQAVVESNEVAPELPFCQLKHPQLPQLPLMVPVLQALPQLHCSSLKDSSP